MSETFNKPTDGEMRKSGQACVRPKDAATLVLIKKVNRKNCVLMGQRARGHKFMPDRYVFPGGRVDRADGYAPQGKALKPRVAKHLEKAATPHRARALAMAAIRETFEETGMILGNPIKNADKPERVSESWRSFVDAGFTPALDHLEYLCRAVTPPYRPVRFNARFLVADGNRLEGDMGGTGELLYLDWVPIKDAMELHLPNITRRVLGDLSHIINEPEKFRRRKKSFLFHQVHGQHIFTEE
jgi:8-oxo-dGTP pyrophosphatase MutT (NUDIX family)